MNFNEFKEQFTEDVKQGLADAGIDAKISINTVEKMNETYEAMTVTPEGSNVGVNVNMEKFFEAYENGTPYEDVVDKAVNVIEGGFANQPTVDVSALTDYDQMKDKLIMEVVSAEANADMLDKVPHKDMEDMAVVYRFEINSNDDGRATILVTNSLKSNTTKIRNIKQYILATLYNAPLTMSSYYQAEVLHDFPQFAKKN